MITNKPVQRSLCAYIFIYACAIFSLPAAAQNKVASDALPVANVPTASSNIKAMRISQNTERLRTVLDLDVDIGSDNYRVFFMDKPHRVILDLFATKTPAAKALPDFKQLPSKANLLQDVQMVASSERLRFIFFSEHALKLNSRVLPALEGKGSRLVLDMQPVDATLAIKAGGTLAPKSYTSISDAASDAQINNSKINVKYDGKPKKVQDFLVVVDAGHGGFDSGAYYFGVKEKDLTLILAKQLAAQINAVDGMRAILTRDSDVYVDLRVRPSDARNNKGDFFVSLHADAAPVRSAKTARGASVFVLSEHGLEREAHIFFNEHKKFKYANGENNYIGDVNLKPYSKPVQKVLVNISQNSVLEDSVKAAEAIIKQFGKDKIRMHSKRVEPKTLMVLQNPDVPAILIETGFLSNKADFDLLMSTEYQAKITKSILNGIYNYYINHPKE